MKKNPLPISQ